MMSTRLTLRQGRRRFFVIIACAIVFCLGIVSAYSFDYRTLLPASWYRPVEQAAVSSCGKMPSLNETGKFKITNMPNGRRIVDERCGFICYTNDSYEQQSIWCYHVGE